MLQALAAFAHLMEQAYHTQIACRTARALVEALRAGDEALRLPFVVYRAGGE